MTDLIFNFNGQTIKHGQETILCGIVNVTPDSFSDGGKWYGTQKAVDHALDLIAQGAGMIDIGGESTRPGSTYVDIQEEIDRVVPVIKALKEKTSVPISIDTWKGDVAEAAVEAGADIVNDITGLLGDRRMAEVVANSKAGLILMFNPVIARPDHPSAKVFPSFGPGDIFSLEELEHFKTLPINQVMKFYFEKSLNLADAVGISKEQIQLDPGIGFGLTKQENLQLIHDVKVIHDWGYTCFLGVSRKRFIQNILAKADFNIDTETDQGFANRDAGSAALTAIAASQGIEVVRVHAIREHKLAASVGNAVYLADQVEPLDLQAYK